MSTPGIVLPQTIAMREPEALLELGNRTDINVGSGTSTPSRLDIWYRNSYIELCMNVPLETLEVLGFEGQFVQGQQVYPLPPDARFPNCITMNTSGGDFTNAYTQSVITIEYTDIKVIRQMTSQSPGPPAVFALFNNQLIVAPTPDQNYYYLLDYWQLPQIGDQNGVVANTQLLVPMDWLEIVDMGALMRGFKALLERDKARELQELLYGFKTQSGKQVPGYITYRQTQQQAGSEHENYALQPRMRKYTG